MEGNRRQYSEEFKKDAVGHSLTSENPTLTVDFLRSLILCWFSRIMQKSFSLCSVFSRQKLM
jgi:hypothetical protein